MTCELITEDGDTVNGTTGLKVGLDIFGRRAIVNLSKVRGSTGDSNESRRITNVSNENASVVDECLLVLCLHWHSLFTLHLFHVGRAFRGCLQLS